MNVLLFYEGVTAVNRLLQSQEDISSRVPQGSGLRPFYSMFLL